LNRHVWVGAVLTELCNVTFAHLHLLKSMTYPAQMNPLM